MTSATDSLDFRLLFEGAPGLFLVLNTDRDFTILGASNAYLHATLTTREGIVGRGVFDVFPDNPDDPAATGAGNLRASLERVVTSGKPDTMAVLQYDIRRPESDGGGFEVRFWSPVNVPIAGADGSTKYIVHRVEDVTDFVRLRELDSQHRSRSQELEERSQRMQTEVLLRSRELDAKNKELREANERLSELDRAKTTFFSNISHEFRTPLTLLLGPVADCLADKTTPLAPRHHAKLELVERNAQRLLKLVNALLDFSRIEAGRMRGTFRPTDLSTQTRQLAEMFGSAFEAAHLTLDIQCPPMSEPAWVDWDMWEKIVLNLVSNAFKFTAEGGVRVRLAETPGNFELEVKDSGTGIPPEEMPRIFERFHRIEGAQSRTHEGTGIGLSLVQELVALHGGAVLVESAPGAGTTFVVSIPKGNAHLTVDAIEPSARDNGQGTPLQDAARVLSAWIPLPEEHPHTPSARLRDVRPTTDPRSEPRARHRAVGGR